MTTANEFNTLKQAAARAEHFDQADPLRRWRDQFHIPRDQHGREQEPLDQASDSASRSSTERYPA